MASSARSLGDWLRTRSDAELEVLLTARPDLSAPAPADVTVLAARAGARGSVTRALEYLARPTLELLEVLTLLPDPTRFADVQQLAGPQASADRLAELRSLALVWGGNDDELHLVRTVREVLDRPLGFGRPVTDCLARHGAGQLEPVLSALGLPATADRSAAIHRVSTLFGDPSRLSAVLAGLDPPELLALDRLADGPPLGTVAGALRVVGLAEAATPVGRLLARGLLVGVDPETVEIPREVAQARRLARTGSALGRLHPDPPELPARRREQTDVDAASAAQAVDFLRLVTNLLDQWAEDPPAVLKAGGLGVRDLRAAARRLDVEEPVAALVAEVAVWAGLADITAGSSGYYAPTPQYDVWAKLPPANQWVLLVTAWVEFPRLPGLVGARDTTSGRDRVLAALGPDVERFGSSELRRDTFEVLDQSPAGTSFTADQVLTQLEFRAPRRGGRLRAPATGWALAEAEIVGFTGRAALTTAGRRLLAGELDGASSALARALPKPIERLVLQADLTAVAPGPLRPDLARQVAAMAEVESTGAATVYRFTETSVRRALDQGRTADDIYQLLTRLSVGDVPQGLTYLVDDVARRHGSLRTGAAGSYLRCDDPTLLAEVLTTRGLSELGLRRLAPTVLISSAAPNRLLDQLRARGFAPVAESADGAVITFEAGARRTPLRPRPVRSAGHILVPEAAEVVVREIRAGERAAAATTPVRRGVTPLRDRSAATTLAVLQEAVRAQTRVWLGYVNADGAASERVVAPKSVDGGILVAFDERSQERRSFALHRITGLAVLDSPEQQDTPA